MYFTKLFRYLLREEFYEPAYGRLRKSGPFSLKIAQGVVQNLAKGSYRPVFEKVKIKRKIRRRKKVPPTFELSFKDKLLQEAVREIVEAIYEPLFLPEAYGFRPGKSCLGCLRSVEAGFNDAVWLARIDISLESIDPKLLIAVLEKKIRDQRFISVIRAFLKAGLMKEWRQDATFSGTSLGSPLAQTLAAVFLNELDLKVKELQVRFSREAGSEAGTSGEAKGSASSKKLLYARYASSLILGVCGSKADCEAAVLELKGFLLELKLQASVETVHSSDGIRFLGYDVLLEKTSDQSGFSKSVTLLAPLKDRIQKILFIKKATIQTRKGKLKPIHRLKTLGWEDAFVVELYAAEIQRVLGYYRLAKNYRGLAYFRHLMEHSCLKSMARNGRTSVGKLLEKYRKDGVWSVPRKDGSLERLPRLDECRNGLFSDIVGVPGRRK
jgi:hypothetical protein